MPPPRWATQKGKENFSTLRDITIHIQKAGGSKGLAAPLGKHNDNGPKSKKNRKGRAARGALGKPISAGRPRPRKTATLAKNGGSVGLLCEICANRALLPAGQNKIGFPFAFCPSPLGCERLSRATSETGNEQHGAQHNNTTTQQNNKTKEEKSAGAGESSPCGFFSLLTKAKALKFDAERSSCVCCGDRLAPARCLRDARLRAILRLGVKKKTWRAGTRPPPAPQSNRGAGPESPGKPKPRRGRQSFV